MIGMLTVALLPLCVHNNYYLQVLSFIAIYVILAVGLNLLMGYAGQISLGHAAFFASGAYTSAVLTTQHHLNPWLAMLIGVLITCTIAYLIGVPCLRLHGHYLAMATLGFGWIVFIVLKHWEVTQGTSGIELIPGLSIGRLAFSNDISKFYLTWATAILTLVISANIVNSRVGRALRALHGSEIAAATLGINLARYKLQVFILSAAYASVAGSLYAHTVHFISPSVFGFNFSVELVVMVVIGGMASVWGALLGASTITLLVQWLRAVPALKDYEVIVYGATLMLVMIFMPAGLVCGIRDLLRTFFRRKASSTPVQQPKEMALK